MNTFSAGSRRLRICRVLAFLTASVAACASVTIASAQTTSRADQVRALNGEVLKLQSEARRARAAEASAAVVKALEGRALALRALMASDPAAAERLAFPASVLAALEASFPNATASLEQRGHWTGELEYLIEDSVDLKSHRAVFKLHGAQEVLEVKFAGREPPGSLSGQRLSVGGVRSGRLVVASEVERLDAQQGGSATADALALACGPLGSQNVVSILVNLPSYKLPAVTTPDFVRGVLLGNAYAGSATASPDRSVDDFWRQASDGQTAVNAAAASVVGPVTLASDFNKDANGASYCDYYGMANAAMAAVDNQVDFRQYSRVQLIVPPNGACGWAGVANVGCRTQSTAGDGTFTASSAWQRADTMQSRGSAVQLSTHELGHNLGMSHASSRDFGTEPLGALGSAGTLSEYGDPHSTMGSWNFGFYAASHAANQLTWLAAGANYLTVESSGTYTIQNYEARPAGLKALKVRRGTGNDAWLWIESRQNTGLYSAALNSALFTGALIHYQDATTGGKSHLLDFSSGSGSFASAALQAGQTWTDPYSNVAVTVNAVTPGALTLTVNYGATPCTQAAPTVTAAPTATSAEYGSAATFDVTVRNNDGASCASQTVSLASAGPAEWTRTFGTASFSLAPGQVGATTLRVGVPAPYALGTYEVTASATGSSGSGSSKQNVTVTEPTNRLSINLSGSGSVSVSTPVKSCTASCAVDYASGTATTVTLTATPGSRTSFAGWSGACSGTTTSCTLTVNADTTVNATFSKSGGTRRK